MAREGTLTADVLALKRRKLSNAAIAEALGTTPGTVAQLVYQARHKKKARRTVAKWQRENPERHAEHRYRVKLRRCGVELPEARP